ncbi:phage tail assembly chaperone [Kordiimonas sp. A6E486]|nr:phage tail assembly chaperone [Kordiimonas marina]
MEAAGLLGWSPTTTFRATLPELLLALNAVLDSRGLLPDDTPAAMTRAELNDLMERYAL